MGKAVDFGAENLKKTDQEYPKRWVIHILNIAIDWNSIAAYCCYMMLYDPLR